MSFSSVCRCVGVHVNIYSCVVLNVCVCVSVFIQSVYFPCKFFSLWERAIPSQLLPGPGPSQTRGSFVGFRSQTVNTAQTSLAARCLFSLTSGDTRRLFGPLTALTPGRSREAEPDGCYGNGNETQTAAEEDAEDGTGERAAALSGHLPPRLRISGPGIKVRADFGKGKANQ